MPPEPDGLPFIFVSYAHADQEFVTRLLADLAAQSVPCWVDHQGLPPGTSDWEQAVRGAIHGCRALLLVASPESRRSRFVKAELDVAELHGRPILPLWAAGEAWIESIPLGLSTAQFADARGERYEQGLAAIVAALRAGLVLPGRATVSRSATTIAAPVDADRHNLPVMVSRLIGRESEQREVRSLLVEARLVTLLGSGGVGKTRLALAVASELVDHYADGVRLVELAALSDPALVLGTVAQILGVREEPGRPLLDTLSEHLKEKRLLLVLDNCEHLVGACAELVSRLVRTCAHLRILATSREGLEVAGERHYRVPSLPVPDLSQLPPPEQLVESAAVALFVARAQERRPDFVLSEQDAPAVAQVCARVDGIPLAIELAAARIGSLHVTTIAARLDQSLRLLTGGPRDALPRQQTLRATLDWSWDLLGTAERVLLARFSVFAGGWTLEAAEATCVGTAVQLEKMVDLLGGLVNKSLVQVQEADGEARYRLLEPVRQYAAERLLEVDGYTILAEQHLDWCLLLAEKAIPRLIGPDQRSWLARLETEHDNLRAALGRSMAVDGTAVKGLHLAVLLFEFWLMHGHLGEGRRWLDETLAHGGTRDAPPALRARALGDVGFLTVRQGDHTRAGVLVEASLAIFRELGDTKGVAGSINLLGIVAWSKGDYSWAVSLWEEALTLFRELGNKGAMVGPLSNLGAVAMGRGNFARAATLFDEGLALARELGDTLHIATSLRQLGAVAMYQGNYAQARALFEEGHVLFHQVGDQGSIADSIGSLGWLAYLQGEDGPAATLFEEALAIYRKLDLKLGIAESLCSLGMVVCRQSDRARAASLLRESLLLSRDIGVGGPIADNLESLAWLAAASEQPRRAARLGGTAETLRESLALTLMPGLRDSHDQMVQAALVALGEQRFATDWAEGRALPLEAAIAEALERPTSN